MNTNTLLKLVAALGLPQIAGGIGALFTTSAIPTWYATLQRPEIAPPNWVFGPVWTTLYVIMGVAAFLVWQKGLYRKDVKVALSLFLVQLLLNTLWSILFFGMQNPGAAFIEIIVLWLAILATITTFAKVSRVAAWLLIPYLAWVSFAAYLNYSFWMVN
jgi:translocator protein